MFGLFYYTYDYYEWEELKCIADTKEELVEYYNTKINKPTPEYMRVFHHIPTPPLIDTMEEHNDCHRVREQPHYFIQEVTYISKK